MTLSNVRDELVAADLCKEVVQGNSKALRPIYYRFRNPTDMPGPEQVVALLRDYYERTD